MNKIRIGIVSYILFSLFLNSLAGVEGRHDPYRKHKDIDTSTGYTYGIALVLMFLAIPFIFFVQTCLDHAWNWLYESDSL